MVHIVDETYELFRQFFAPGRPAHVNDAGIDISAARAVARNMVTMWRRASPISGWPPIMSSSRSE